MRSASRRISPSSFLGTGAAPPPRTMRRSRARAPSRSTVRRSWRRPPRRGPARCGAGRRSPPARPSTATTTSPGSRPARSAGLSRRSSTTTTPPLASPPCPTRVSVVATSAMRVMPTQPRTTRPWASELLHDLARQLGGHREADALVAARLGVDGGVDADELAARVDQGAAGVAGVDGGVGLDEVLVVHDAHVGAARWR